MNNERRKIIAEIASKIRDCLGPIEELKDALDAPKSEEEEYHDNMPESLQQGEKGEKSQAAFDAMEEADNNLQEALDALENAASKLEEIE